jgi:chromate reductase
MSQSFKVAVFVGSLRKDSLSRKYAAELARLAPPSLRFTTVEIGNLPYYDPDADNENAPKSWQHLRRQINDVDAVLFVTPEYNRSIPAALKNALDVASRPYGQGAWNGKPGLVVSVSPGGMGGYGAAQHLRQILSVVNVPVMAQPEAYIGNADKLLGLDGTVNNDATRKFLELVLAKFAAWIAANGNH